MSCLKKIDPNSEECILPYCRECGGAYLVLILVSAFIVFRYLFLVGAVGKENVVQRDHLNYQLFQVPWLENCCSFWPISHLVLFFILGLLFPDCWLALGIIGVAWELIEVAFDKMEGKRQPIRMRENRRKVEYSGNWWAGSWKDVFMNFTGLGLGVFLAKVVKIKICIPGFNKDTKFCQKEKCKGCI